VFDWHFGNSPFTSEGITGGLDDIRIYNRALTAAELTTIFPDQPRGVFDFVNQQETAEENEVPAAVNELSIPVSRTQGDDGEVSVGYKLVSGSAILDTDFRLKGDLQAPGSVDRGKGTLTWGIHDATDKNIIVELIGDDLREGTETFTIELERLGSTEPELGSNNIVDVIIADKTPNPYGAIGFAPMTASENIAVDEGQSGIITVERDGSDSQGGFDVTYETCKLAFLKADPHPAPRPFFAAADWVLWCSNHPPNPNFRQLEMAKEILYRSSIIARQENIDEEARTIELSFSSEAPALHCRTRAPLELRRRRTARWYGLPHQCFLGAQLSSCGKESPLPFLVGGSSGLGDDLSTTKPNQQQQKRGVELDADQLSEKPICKFHK
jgi:hypothetical protein